MMKLALPLALASALVVPVAAHADTFAVNFGAAGGANGFSGTGTIDATNNNGVYTINSITGGNASQGLTVTGLIGVNGFDGNDNELFPGGSPNDKLLVDASGFAFTASQVNANNQGNTSYVVRIYSTGGAYFLDLTDSDGFSNGMIPANFSATNATTAVTPEPSSLALMGTGALALVGAVRRRFARA